jgi:cystathionine beta-lyase
MELETLLARISDNCKINDPYGATHIPIYQTATFDLKKQSSDQIYDYSRTNNPTRNALEDIFTIAENGAGCVCTNTGLSALALLFETVLKTGDDILVEMDSYGGTYRLLKIFTEKFGIKVHSTDFVDLRNVESFLIEENIKLVICESPTNPGLKVLDISEVAKLCKKYNVLLAIDNSLATFASQKPLDLGADFSVFSATKYISGHGSVISGALVSKSEEWVEKMAYFSNAEGRAQSPFDAFLISIGLPTLTYRMKIHEQSALKVADYLTSRNDIVKVRFPFLPSHPQYELAKRQMKVCPGVLTIQMESTKIAEKLIKKTKLFGEKASFGTADSRIELPAKISHAAYSDEDLTGIGITKSSLRLSIGLENVDDLINDIETALR